MRGWRSDFSFLLLISIHIGIFRLLEFGRVQHTILEEVVLAALLHMSGACIALKILMMLGSRVKRKAKIHRLLKENGMGIYLFHQQIIYIMIALLNGKCHPIFLTTLPFFISISFSIGIMCILRKFKTTRFLIGEK